MTDQTKHNLRVHLLAADYLTAVESENLDAIEALWKLADMMPGLATALRETHDGLAEEARTKNAD